MLQLLILTPGAVGGGLAVFGAVLEVLNSDRKLGLSKECRSRRVTPAWLKNLRELPEPKYCQVFHSLALVPIPDLILNCIKPSNFSQCKCWIAGAEEGFFDQSHPKWECFESWWILSVLRWERNWDLREPGDEERRRGYLPSATRHLLLIRWDLHIDIATVCWGDVSLPVST